MMVKYFGARPYFADGEKCEEEVTSTSPGAKYGSVAAAAAAAAALLLA